MNNGEVAQYYVQSNHEAIISCEVFDLVQQELSHRKNHLETTKGSSIFSGRICCGLCGGTFGSKVWHSKDRYRKIIWQCNDKYKHKGNTCTSPHLSEEELKVLFVKAVNQLIGNKDEIIRSFEEIKNEIFDASKDEIKLHHLEAERMEIIKAMDQLIAENASMTMDQAGYKKKHGRLLDHYHEVESQISEMKHAIQGRQYHKTKTKLFLKALGKQSGVVTGFSNELWHSLANHAEVHGKEDMRFIFKNGMEIKV